MVEHKKTFYLHGGKTINTLKGFAKELIDMPTATFKHHVTLKNNDFANWIKHSIKNETLAKRIDGQISKIEIELEVLRHVVHEAQVEEAQEKPKIKKQIKKSTSKKTIKKNKK